MKTSNSYPLPQDPDYDQYLNKPIHFNGPQQQPSQLPMAKGNCFWYCHRRENHRQQIFAVDHLFTIRYEPFSILLNTNVYSFKKTFLSWLFYLKYKFSIHFRLQQVTMEWAILPVLAEILSSKTDAQAIANISLYYVPCRRAQFSCL